MRRGLFRPTWAPLAAYAVLALWDWDAGQVAAQPAPLPDTIFTVGTTTPDASGRQWAYILWVGSDNQLVVGRQFAVYAKAGDAASTNPFERRAITGLQTEPPVIRALLNRAVSIGENLPQLETRVDSLFAALQPPAGPLEQKLSAVIRGTITDPAQLNSLVLLGRLHPGVNFCLGYAHAEVIPASQTTFEIREYDKANDRDLGVVGRVTVTAGSPVALPAPGPVVQVPEFDPRGDLNVKLRWASSDALRRLTLLNHGFNVYRVTRAHAEAQGWHTTPPAPAVLRAAAGSHPAVKRVNELPVLKTKDFSAADVGNFVLDPKTAFLADDNGRYQPGGVPFENGAQFYYFVTSRDVLGRDWGPSPGLLVKVCDRLPPDAPLALRVENDYIFTGGAAKQKLKVLWRPNTNTADTVNAYYVYRWLAPDDVQAAGGNPLLNRIAGPIPHVPGQALYSYVDDGAGSPTAPADYSKTFWYTIRSVDHGACDGGNFSAHSRPVFGVLRDRTGPDGPGGRLEVLCCTYAVVGRDPADFNDPDGRNQDPALAYYELEVRRERPEIRWAEFYFRELVESNFLGRVYFSPQEPILTLRWTVTRALVQEGFVPFWCRVGDDRGQESDFAAVSTVRDPKTTTIRRVPFAARVDCHKIPRRSASTGQLGLCRGTHNPLPQGPDGPVQGPSIIIQLTPGTKEYRLYRRVDHGPLTLIKQGPANADDLSSITVEDPDMPANAAVICYFAQLFDEHGNASPLVQIDDCVEIQMPMAFPLLAPLEPVGDDSSPKMKVRWFCPPYGVNRFEVSIANAIGFMPPNPSPDLGTQITNRIKHYLIGNEPRTNVFFLYRTPPVGPAFGNGAQFEVTVNIAQGQEYTVMVAAVGPDGLAGPDSNAESLSWHVPPLVGPDVPWPARPLPDVNVFHPSLQAARMPDNIFPGLAIRIGEVPRRHQAIVPTERQDLFPSSLRQHRDPMNYVYTNKLGEKLFPAVVYRVPFPSAEFFQVSWDLIQVTPLMETIAHQFTTHPEFGNITVIHDPFIRMTEGVVLGGMQLPGALWLVDTQPVVFGSAYAYLIVRLGPDGEIREVVVTNPVEVTP